MIFIFRTSVKLKEEISDISNHIDQIDGILEWNFDLEDCDNILRIVANRDVVNEVCKKLNFLNYVCEDIY